MRRRILLVIVGLGHPGAESSGYGQATRLHPHRIAVFGSSVANGRGDEFARDGYTGLLRVMMAQRGWEVLNQSRGGDNTKTLMTRFAPEGAPDPEDALPDDREPELRGHRPLVRQRESLRVENKG